MIQLRHLTAAKITTVKNKYEEMTLVKKTRHILIVLTHFEAVF